MKIILSALLCLSAVSAYAGGAGILFGSGGATGATAVGGQPISPSTVTISLNGASNPGVFPYSPLMIFGNGNTYLQAVIQNLSNGNNASTDLILNNDQATDSAWYLDIGINSSKFSQAGQSVEPSSSSFIVSSDSPLILWADGNGGLNGGNGHVLIGSSNTVIANEAVDISSNAVVFQANTPVTISSAVFMGVSLSTQSVGGAGASVTAICYTAGTFALGGGCNCSSAVAETANISVPNCVTAGCHPTGWTCQVSGGTGGQCSAFAICSRGQ